MKNVSDQVFELLQSTGTNWRVSKQPLFNEGGTPANSFGIFRDDSGECISTVGKIYEPFQNFNLAETIIEAANRLELDTFRGGMLSNGGKVYYQVALKDAAVATDTIKRHITALNSHDGSSSIGFGSSSTVVICQNTFYRAYDEIEKFRHTTTAEERIKVAMMQLSAAIQQDGKMIENFSRMAEKKITTPIFEQVVKSLFNVESLGVTSSDISTRKANQLKGFADAVEKETARHGGRTLWSLFNAVTFYTNHIETKNAKGEQTKSPIQNIMSGEGFNKNALAYDAILQWVESHTAEAVLINLN